MSKKCPMCHAALPDVEKEIESLTKKLTEAESRINELETAIKEAKEADTKDEADNIFDSI